MREDGFCVQKLFTTQAVWCGRQLNSAAPNSSLELFWYGSRRKPFLWLTWPIFQHQLSTVINWFGPCQDLCLGRLQHIQDPVAGWPKQIENEMLCCNSLSISKFRNQAKTTTVVETQLVIYSSICLRKQKLSVTSRQPDVSALLVSFLLCSSVPQLESLSTTKTPVSFPTLFSHVADKRCSKS